MKQSSSADAKTFITGVQREQTKKMLLGVDYEHVPKAKEIEEHFFGLNTIIDDLNTKISDVIQYHEKDFFAAFKNRMYQIKQEMKVLKENRSTFILCVMLSMLMLMLSMIYIWIYVDPLLATKDYVQLSKKMFSKI